LYHKQSTQREEDYIRVGSPYLVMALAQGAPDKGGCILEIDRGRWTEKKGRINNEKDGKTDQVDSDDQCFRWCCLHQLLKTQNIHRLRNNLRKNNSALNGGGDLDYICK